VSRLSRQCGIVNISQPYSPPRPVTGMALLFSLLKNSSLSHCSKRLLCKTYFWKSCGFVALVGMFMRIYVYDTNTSVTSFSLPFLLPCMAQSRRLAYTTLSNCQFLRLGEIQSASLFFRQMFVKKIPHNESHFVNFATVTKRTTTSRVLGFLSDVHLQS
jgi:hypothetical protein